MNKAVWPPDRHAQHPAHVGPVTAADLRPGAAGPVLIAHDLTYDYGRHRALDGLGFQLARGEVLGLLARGFTLSDIARQLEISRHTVGDHVKNLYRKLDISSRAQAALHAQRFGLT
jgi:DNA-binding CsgD family transcriptional regulator